MRSALLLTGLLTAAAPVAMAQVSVPRGDDGGPGVTPMRRLDSGAQKPKTNEVSVVLDDADPTPKSPEAPKPKVAATPPKTAPVEPPGDAVPHPVLVTGKPPEHAELVAEPETSPAPPKSEKGVKVKIVDVQGGKGPIDASQVKLLFPFPPKPLAAAPAGWAFDASGNAPAFLEEVELAPGSKLTLKIHPHVLIPVADGKEVFEVNEPGFDPSLGYQQVGTVGTILATSVAQLEEDSRQLGAAIDRLQELLTSLPSPEPESEIPVATPVKDSPLLKKR